MSKQRNKQQRIKQKRREQKKLEKRKNQIRVFKKVLVYMATIFLILLPLLISIIIYQSAQKHANTNVVAPGTEKLQLGTYPQTMVDNNKIIAALAQNKLEWKYYEDCYSGDGFYGTMKQTKCMKFADTEYEGQKYRAVMIEQYRPGSTLSPATAEESRQDDNGFELNKTYWFRFEPIQWIVLNGNVRFALSEKVLDAMPFNSAFYWVDRNLDQVPDIDKELSSTKYLYTPANLYKSSSIRKWLNNGFFSDAFSKSDKTIIKRAWHLTDESFDHKRYGLLALNYDKVFLPSFRDYLKFNDDGLVPVTDYARCRGAFSSVEQNTSFSWQWLSTPGDYCADVVSVYFNEGLINFDRQFFYAYSIGGIRCAAYLKNPR